MYAKRGRVTFSSAERICQHHVDPTWQIRNAQLKKRGWEGGFGGNGGNGGRGEREREWVSERKWKGVGVSA